MLNIVAEITHLTKPEIQNMIFQTIENLTVAEITDLFNAAFADYVVKVQFTQGAMQEKITLSKT